MDRVRTEQADFLEATLGVGAYVERLKQLCIACVAGDATFAHRALPSVFGEGARLEEWKTWQRPWTWVVAVIDELHAVWSIGDEILLVRADRRAVAARDGRDTRAGGTLADAFPPSQVLALPCQIVRPLPAEADVGPDGRHAGGLGTMFGDHKLVCLDRIRTNHVAAYLSTWHLSLR